MVKEVEEKETPKVETEEVEAPETPTAEEQLVTLQEEKRLLEERVTTVEKERDEKATGLKTAHSKLTKADQDSKKRADVDTRIDELESLWKMGFGMLIEKGEAPDEIDTEKRREATGRFDAEVKKMDADKEKRRLQAQQDENTQQVMAMSERAEAAFGEDVDSVASVRDMLVKGYFDLAEKKIAKAEGKATPESKESSKETEEQKVERLAEERYNKRLEEEGLLHTETALPSGRSRTQDELRAKHAAGEITTDEAKKAGLTF